MVSVNIIIIIIIIINFIIYCNEFPLGGSSPYDSTGKTIKKKWT